MSVSADKGRSYGSLSILVRDDMRVVCHRYPDRGPILSISSPALSVMFCDAVTEQTLTFARGLADAAEQFLVACELRLTAESPADRDRKPSASAA